jgi:phage terminase large subunit-like protein
VGSPQHVRRHASDRGKWRHIAIIAETAADARDVMVGDGKEPSNPSAGSGILQVHSKDFLPLYEPSKRRLTWPNGTVASIYNATEPEQLRGPEHSAAWCDELCKWVYAQETWALAVGICREADVTDGPAEYMPMPDHLPKV